MTFVNKAYEEIKRNILENRYPPGCQALEGQLAEELEMSRTPVREALIRLSEEGLVELVPRRGMRVVPLSPADMQEIYEVLAALEVKAVELLARRRPSEEDFSGLEAAVNEMEAALAADDLDNWAQADERFHKELVALSRNRRLIAMVASLADQVRRARLVTLRLRPKPTRSNSEHRQALEALKSGDWDRAEALHRQHRRQVADALIEIMAYYRLPHL